MPTKNVKLPDSIKQSTIVKAPPEIQEMFKREDDKFAEEALVTTSEVHKIQQGNKPVGEKEIVEADILSSEEFKEEFLDDPYQEEPIKFKIKDDTYFIIYALPIYDLMKLLNIFKKINMALLYPELIFSLPGELENDFPVYREYIDILRRNSNMKDMSLDDFMKIFDQSAQVNANRYIMWMNDIDLFKKKVDQRSKGKVLKRQAVIN